MTAILEADAIRIARIRSQFPALARRVGDRPVAYLDGPGGTQVPRAVAEAVSDYLLHHNANTHWEYPTSRETDALLADARRTAADFLNAEPEEIVFGPNMTTLTYHVSRTLGRGLGPGDEVITTELDHHANVAPWTALAAERGVTIRRVPFGVDDGRLDWAALEAAIGPQTKVVAIGWASNALGTITDVATVCGMARQAGAISFVDAVHSAPHVLPDVRALGCDFLACSPYKFYGPHLGLLYGRRALLESLPVPKLEPAPERGGERWELGTQNHEGIVGAAAAIDFLAGLDGDAAGSRRERLVRSYGWLHRRGAEQVRALWDGLAGIPGVRRVGPPPESPRTPTVSVVTPIPSAELASRLATQGVFVSHGDFYAATVVERLGVEGLVRIGCSCFTDPEVEQVLEALPRVLR
ncbi:MAG: cysteine desulfurase-like protein [Gemmatimonadales bacterium]